MKNINIDFYDDNERSHQFVKTQFEDEICLIDTVIYSKTCPFPHTSWFIVVETEFKVPTGKSNISLDIVCIDEYGIPFVVEGKIFSFKDGRDGDRKVIGQIFEYKTYFEKGCSSYLLRSKFENPNAEKHKNTSIEKILLKFGSEDNFWRIVEQNIHEKKFNYVIVADEISQNLRNIAENLFINEYSSLFLIEAQKYETQKNCEFDQPQLSIFELVNISKDILEVSNESKFMQTIKKKMGTILKRNYDKQ